MSLKSLQGAKGKPPATVAQMAAVEFKSVTRLVGMPQVEREKAVRNIVKTVYQAAQIALEIVTRTGAISYRWWLRTTARSARC
jgi:hypothetical protein